MSGYQLESVLCSLSQSIAENSTPAKANQEMSACWRVDLPIRPVDWKEVIRRLTVVVIGVVLNGLDFCSVKKLCAGGRFIEAVSA